jgi:hypothetical protein
MRWYLLVINATCALASVFMCVLTIWAWRSHDALVTDLVAVIGMATVMPLFLIGVLPAMVALKMHPACRRHAWTAITTFAEIQNGLLNGPFIAALENEPGKIFTNLEDDIRYAVIVDGIDPTGQILIRDPFGGRRIYYGF